MNKKDLIADAIDIKAYLKDFNTTIDAYEKEKKDVSSLGLLESVSYELGMYKAAVEYVLFILREVEK